MEEKYKIIKQVLGSERVKLDEPLKYHLISAEYTKADCFYIATTIKELIDALEIAHELKVPYFIFGSGTKTILTDEKLEGLVIKNRTAGLKISGVKGKVSSKGIGVQEAMIEVESGVSMGKLNEFLKVQGLATFDVGIVNEATVGGTLFIDDNLKLVSQKIKIWSPADVSDIDILELKRSDVILSVILKVMSAS